MRSRTSLVAGRPAAADLTLQGAPGAARRSVRIAAEAIAFQPDAIEVEERRLPAAARVALYAILGLVAFCCGWAWFAEVDRVVYTQGRLIEDGPRMVVQPLVSSVIRSVHVQIGDEVRKGQLLVQLDPTLPRADVAQTQGELDSLRAEIAHLHQELSPPKAQATGPPQAAGELPDAATLHRLRDALATGGATTAGEQRGRLRVLAQITAMQRQLVEAGYGSRLSYLQALNEQQRYQAELEQRLAEAKRRRDRLVQELAKAQRLQELSELRAADDGVVLEVSAKSAGAVLQAAEPAVVLVPPGTPLEAEVNLPAHDIGWVRPGQPVRLKLDAFPFQQHGVLEGVVKVISPDTLPERSGERTGVERDTGTSRPVYRTRIEIVSNPLRGLPEKARLVPGMTVSAEIKVGKRRVLSYFLDPVLKGLDESIREPR